MPIIGGPSESADWSYSLIDVDGVEHPMNAEDGYTVLSGIAGALMPPVEMRDRALPLRAGSALQGVRVAARDASFPVLIEAPTHAGVVARHENLLSWIDPTRGSVAWRVSRPDGNQRELICTYLSGFEGEETESNGVYDWWTGVGTFRAHEPYWRDVDEIVREYAIDVDGGNWFPMVFPIQLTGSQIFRMAAENNTGSAETYPVWTITGPGVNPVLRNMVNGKYMALEKTLDPGEQVIIDMAPLVAVPIRDASGNSLFHMQVSGSERWPLLRGGQVIQIEMTDANEASAVKLQYRRRWLRR